MKLIFADKTEIEITTAQSQYGREDGVLPEDYIDVVIENSSKTLAELRRDYFTNENCASFEITNTAGMKKTYIGYTEILSLFEELTNDSFKSIVRLAVPTKKVS